MFLIGISACVLAGTVVLYQNIREVDVMSGRLRYRTRIGRYVLFEAIEETEFSQLARGCGKSPRSASWRMVWSRTPWNRISPHYRYHSVPNDLQMFLYECQNRAMTKQQQRKLVCELLAILQQNRPRALRRWIEDFIAKGDAG